MRVPTEEEVAAAKQELAEEDARARSWAAARAEDPHVLEIARRTRLPSEHPDHVHGLMCDGQDGDTSYCMRLRRKLFG